MFLCYYFWHNGPVEIGMQQKNNCSLVEKRLNC